MPAVKVLLPDSVIGTNYGQGKQHVQTYTRGHVGVYKKSNSPPMQPHGDLERVWIQHLQKKIRVRGDLPPIQANHCQVSLQPV